MEPVFYEHEPCEVWVDIEPTGLLNWLDFLGELDSGHSLRLPGSERRGEGALIEAARARLGEAAQ
jgi:hypothetical protein